MVQVATLLAVLEKVMRVRGVRRKTWEQGDVRLVYHEAGASDEEPLVLVHGLGTNWLSWAKVFLPLARRRRVYALDLPGWGDSPFPAGKDHATIPDLAAAVSGFLESVPGRRVTLIGQSLGGWVSVKVAARRPDLVSRLVLCNNAGVHFPEIESLRKKLDLQSQAEVVEFWTEMWHRVPSMYRYFTDDYVAKMHEPRVLRFFDTLTLSDFINDDLANLTVPVSIVWGMSDRFIPISTVDIMLEKLPEARVYWLPDCGHIPALEKPRELLRMFDAILAGPAVPLVPVQLHQPKG